MSKGLRIIREEEHKVVFSPYYLPSYNSLLANDHTNTHTRDMVSKNFILHGSFMLALDSLVHSNHLVFLHGQHKDKLSLFKF